MKRAKKLMLLLGSLIVVIAAYVVLTQVTKEKEPEALGTSEFTLLSIPRDSISGFDWEYEGETVSLERKAGAWKYTQDDAFPLDQSILDGMLSAVTEVKASRTIESPEDLSEYGLAEPKCVITVQTTGDVRNTFIVGNQNDVTGDYYLMLNDKPEVYLAKGSLSDAFAYKLMDLVKTEPIPAMQQIQRFEVDLPDGDLNLVFFESGGDITYTNAYTWFLEVESSSGKGYSPLSATKVSELQSGVKYLAWNRCVNYNADAEALQAYGLLEPRAAVSVQFTATSSQSGTVSGTFRLLIGNTEDDESYAMLEGSKLVYQIDATVAKALTAATYQALRPDDVCLMDWNTVDSMDVVVDGVKKTIAFDRSGDTLVIRVNGTEAEIKAVQVFLSELYAMKADRQLDTNEDGGVAEVSIVFHRNTTEYQVMNLKFTRYDRNYYLVHFAGQSHLLVSRTDLDKLKQAFASL